MEMKRIPVVSPDEFRRLAKRNPNLLHDTPWVVEGYIQHWPGYRQWQDLCYLRRRFGHLHAFAKAPNFITNVRSRIVSVETSFEQYLDYIDRPEDAAEIYDGCWMEGDYEQLKASGLPLYCGTLRLVHQAQDPIFAELQPLLPEPLLSWNHALPYYYSLFNHLWLLVSLPGALTPLHVDNNGTIAMIAQLKGRKRATLYAPDDLSHVRRTDIGFLDPEQPDGRDFPTWAQARMWVADLEPGQVLFVGTNWAHHVRTLETSISVSFDFVDESNLGDYAKAPEWAAAFGSRIKRNAEVILAKLGERVARAEIESQPAEIVGRRIMSHILRSAIDDGSAPHLAAIRERYFEHLQEQLAATRELAA
jgi:hypothetical protein